MSIEPHDARFQFGTRVLPHEVKTSGDYRRDLINRYGRMPYPAELADLECRGKGTHGNTQKLRPKPLTDAQSIRLEEQRARARRKTRATLDRILACLDVPKTAAQMEAELKLSRQSIGAHMRAAYDRGEVDRTSTQDGRTTIWCRA